MQGAKGIIENQSQEDSIEKGDIRKILTQKKNMIKNIRKILNKKEGTKKTNILTIPNETENMKEQIRG